MDRDGTQGKGERRQDAVRVPVWSGRRGGLGEDGGREGGGTVSVGAGLGQPWFDGDSAGVLGAGRVGPTPPPGRRNGGETNSRKAEFVVPEGYRGASPDLPVFVLWNSLTGGISRARTLNYVVLHGLGLSYARHLDPAVLNAHLCLVPDVYRAPVPGYFILLAFLFACMKTQSSVRVRR